MEQETILSISIVNTNNGKILKNCLESLFRNSPSFSYEVFVVDNGSVDGSQEMVRTQFPQAHLIENGSNIGFPRSNNRALRRSKGKYFLLLNDDTIILPGAFDKMIEFMENHPDCGISGIKLVFADGEVQSCKFTFPTLFKEFFHANTLLKNLFARNRKIMWGLRRFYYRAFEKKEDEAMLDYDKVQEVDDILGACFLIRKKVFDEIGNFDEEHFTCRDESDFAFRAKQKGWKVYYNPQATIIHLGGATVKKLNVKYYCQDKISANYFFKKYYSFPKRLGLKLIILEAFLVNMAYESVRFIFSLERAQALENFKIYLNTINKIVFDSTQTSILSREDWLKLKAKNYE